MVNSGLTPERRSLERQDEAPEIPLLDAVGQAWGFWIEDALACRLAHAPSPAVCSPRRYCFSASAAWSVPIFLHPPLRLPATGSSRTTHRSSPRRRRQRFPPLTRRIGRGGRCSTTRSSTG